MNDRNALLRGALATIALYILIVLTLFIPYLSLLTVWLLPVPFMFLAARDGWKSALCLLGLGLLFLIILDHSVYLLIPVFFMLLGGVMGYMIFLKKDAFTLLLAGSLTNIAVLIVCLAISVLVFHFNPASAVQSALNDSFQQTLEQMKPMLESNTDELAAQYKEQLANVGHLTPMILIMIGVFNALITELIGLPILRKLGVDAPRWVPFRLWQVPKSTIWLYLAVLFVGWFEMGNETPLFTVVLNIDLILRIVLAIQGFSLIFYYAHARKFPLIVPITVTLLTVLFGFLLLQMVCILGIIDLGFNLRKRISQKKL